MGGSSRFCISEGLSSLKSGDGEDTCHQCFHGRRHTPGQQLHLWGSLSNKPAGLPVTLMQFLYHVETLSSHKSTVSGLINARIWDWGAEGYKRSAGYSQNPFYHSSLQMGRLCQSSFLSSPASKHRFSLLPMAKVPVATTLQPRLSTKGTAW